MAGFRAECPECGVLPEPVYVTRRDAYEDGLVPHVKHLHPLRAAQLRPGRGASFIRRYVNGLPGRPKIKEVVDPKQHRTRSFQCTCGVPLPDRATAESHRAEHRITETLI